MGLNYTFAGQTGPISLSTLDSALGDASVAGFKNKIIGGDFTTNPWQRGTSFTALGTSTYTADRFFVSHSTDGVVNLLKTADAPTAAQAGVYSAHCLHLDVTTADATIAAGQYYVIRQNVEGLNAASFGFGQSGTRYVTLSFWHKHTKTGVYCVSIFNSAGTRSYVAEYTQDTTDTWEKATITIPIDTTGTWLYDTSTGLSVAFSVAMGSTYHGTANTWTAGLVYSTSSQVNALDSTANNFKIALVQLEAGSVATPFETRSVGQELALCQRYYYRISGDASLARTHFGGGFNTATTNGRVLIQFPQRMWSAPSALEQSGTAADYAVFSGAAVETVCNSVPTFNSGSSYEATANFPVASGLTVGQGCHGRTVTNGTGYLGFSAEL